MKMTFLTMTMAAALTASMAMAQTTDAAEETGATETGASETGVSTAPVTFGSDWSASMGTAVFGDDGMTVRSAPEIETQWQTLSEEDRTMIRRDCTVYMEGKSAAAGAAEEAVTGSGGEAGAGDALTPENSGATDGSGTETTGTMQVSAEQMEALCAATSNL